MEHGAELEIMSDMIPNAVRLSGGRMYVAVQNKALALVVIGSAVVLPNVEIVDRRAEKEFSDIVERL